MNEAPDLASMSNAHHAVTINGTEHHFAQLRPQDYADLAKALREQRRNALIEHTAKFPMSEDCRARMLSHTATATITIADLLNDAEGRYLLLQRSYGVANNNAKTPSLPSMSLVEMTELVDAMCGEGVTVNPPNAPNTTTGP